MVGLLGFPLFLGFRLGFVLGSSGSGSGGRLFLKGAGKGVKEVGELVDLVVFLVVLGEEGWVEGGVSGEVKGGEDKDGGQLVRVDVVGVGLHEVSGGGLDEAKTDAVSEEGSQHFEDRWCLTLLAEQ